MNLPELASLIVDVQPDWGNPDEIIAISAMCDNQLIRSYFCDPRSGVSLLTDYADSELAELFSRSNTLPEAAAVVAGLYREQPLDLDESRCVRAQGLQAVLNSTYKIASNREVGGCQQSHKAIIGLVVNELITHLNTFQT